MNNKGGSKSCITFILTQQPLVLGFPTWGGNRGFVKTTIPTQKKTPTNLRFKRKLLYPSWARQEKKRVELDRIKDLSWNTDRAPDSWLKID